MKIIKSADQLIPTSDDELAALRKRGARRPDTSDLPESRVGKQRVRRDARGKLSSPRSFIREAIVKRMKEQDLTGYQVCKATHGRVPESAIYEFLRGQRQIGLQYIESIMDALDLRIIASGSPALPRESRRQHAAQK